ncbi:MAG: hypothetical protein ABIH41_02530 [Nanoarchaeota archaeon]
MDNSMKKNIGKADLLRMMKKNMDGEVKTITFYLDNLENLNYSKNTKHVEALVLDSVTHLGNLCKAFMSLHADIPAKQPIPSHLRELALTEEKGLREIYQFMLQHSNNAEINKTFEQLVEAERTHEKMVRELK